MSTETAGEGREGAAATAEERDGAAAEEYTLQWATRLFRYLESGEKGDPPSPVTPVEPPTELGNDTARMLERLETVVRERVVGAGTNGGDDPDAVRAREKEKLKLQLRAFLGRDRERSSGARPRGKSADQVRGRRSRSGGRGQVTRIGVGEQVGTPKNFSELLDELPYARHLIRELEQAKAKSLSQRQPYSVLPPKGNTPLPSPRQKYLKEKGRENEKGHARKSEGGGNRKGGKGASGAKDSKQSSAARNNKRPSTGSGEIDDFLCSASAKGSGSEPAVDQTTTHHSSRAASPKSPFEARIERGLKSAEFATKLHSRNSPPPLDGVVKQDPADTAPGDDPDQLQRPEEGGQSSSRAPAARHEDSEKLALLAQLKKLREDMEEIVEGQRHSATTMLAYLSAPLNAFEFTSAERRMGLRSPTDEIAESAGAAETGEKAAEVELANALVEGYRRRQVAHHFPRVEVEVPPMDVAAAGRTSDELGGQAGEPHDPKKPPVLCLFGDAHAVDDARNRLARSLLTAVAQHTALSRATGSAEQVADEPAKGTGGGGGGPSVVQLTVAKRLEETVYQPYLNCCKLVSSLQMPAVNLATQWELRTELVQQGTELDYIERVHFQVQSFDFFPGTDCFAEHRMSGHDEEGKHQLHELAQQLLAVPMVSGLCKSADGAGNDWGGERLASINRNAVAGAPATAIDENAEDLLEDLRQCATESATLSDAEAEELVGILRGVAGLLTSAAKGTRAELQAETHGHAGDEIEINQSTLPSKMSSPPPDELALHLGVTHTKMLAFLDTKVPGTEDSAAKVKFVSSLASAGTDGENYQHQQVPVEDETARSKRQENWVAYLQVKLACLIFQTLYRHIVDRVDSALRKLGTEAEAEAREENPHHDSSSAEEEDDAGLDTDAPGTAADRRRKDGLPRWAQADDVKKNASSQQTLFGAAAVAAIDAAFEKEKQASEDEAEIQRARARSKALRLAGDPDYGGRNARLAKRNATNATSVRGKRDEEEDRKRKGPEVIVQMLEFPHYTHLTRIPNQEGDRDRTDEMDEEDDIKQRHAAHSFGALLRATGRERLSAVFRQHAFFREKRHLMDELGDHVLNENTTKTLRTSPMNKFTIPLSQNDPYLHVGLTLLRQNAREVEDVYKREMETCKTALETCNGVESLFFGTLDKYHDKWIAYVKNVEAEFSNFFHDVDKGLQPARRDAQGGVDFQIRHYALLDRGGKSRQSNFEDPQNAARSDFAFSYVSNYRADFSWIAGRNCERLLSPDLAAVIDLMQKSQLSLLAHCGGILKEEREHRLAVEQMRHLPAGGSSLSRVYRETLRKIFDEVLLGGVGIGGSSGSGHGSTSMGGPAQPLLSRGGGLVSDKDYTTSSKQMDSPLYVLCFNSRSFSGVHQVLDDLASLQTHFPFRCGHLDFFQKYVPLVPVKRRVALRDKYFRAQDGNKKAPPKAVVQKLTTELAELLLTTQLQFELHEQGADKKSRKDQESLLSIAPEVLSAASASSSEERSDADAKKAELAEDEQNGNIPHEDNNPPLLVVGATQVLATSAATRELRALLRACRIKSAVRLQRGYRFHRTRRGYLATIGFQRQLRKDFGALYGGLLLKSAAGAGEFFVAAGEDGKNKKADAVETKDEKSKGPPSPLEDVLPSSYVPALAVYDSLKGMLFALENLEDRIAIARAMPLFSWRFLEKGCEVLHARLVQEVVLVGSTLPALLLGGESGRGPTPTTAARLVELDYALRILKGPEWKGRRRLRSGRAEQMGKQSDGLHLTVVSDLENAYEAERRRLMKRGGQHGDGNALSLSTSTSGASASTGIDVEEVLQDFDIELDLKRAVRECDQKALVETLLPHAFYVRGALLKEEAEGADEQQEVDTADNAAAAKVEVEDEEKAKGKLAVKKGKTKRRRLGEAIERAMCPAAKADPQDQTVHLFLKADRTVSLSDRLLLQLADAALFVCREANDLISGGTVLFGDVELHSRLRAVLAEAAQSGGAGDVAGMNKQEGRDDKVKGRGAQGGNSRASAAAVLPLTQDSRLDASAARACYGDLQHWVRELPASGRSAPPGFRKNDHSTPSGMARRIFGRILLKNGANKQPGGRNKANLFLGLSTYASLPAFARVFDSSAVDFTSSSKAGRGGQSSSDDQSGWMQRLAREKVLKGSILDKDGYEIADEKAVSVYHIPPAKERLGVSDLAEEVADLSLLREVYVQVLRRLNALCSAEEEHAHGQAGPSSAGLKGMNKSDPAAANKAAKRAREKTLTWTMLEKLAVHCPLSVFVGHDQAEADVAVDEDEAGSGSALQRFPDAAELLLRVRAMCDQEQEAGAADSTTAARIRNLLAKDLEARGTTLDELHYEVAIRLLLQQLQTKTTSTGSTTLLSRIVKEEQRHAPHRESLEEFAARGAQAGTTLQHGRKRLRILVSLPSLEGERVGKIWVNEESETAGDLKKKLCEQNGIVNVADGHAWVLKYRSRILNDEEVLGNLQSRAEARQHESVAPLLSLRRELLTTAEVEAAVHSDVRSKKVKKGGVEDRKEPHEGPAQQGTDEHKKRTHGHHQCLQLLSGEVCDHFYAQYPLRLAHWGLTGQVKFLAPACAVVFLRSCFDKVALTEFLLLIAKTRQLKDEIADEEEEANKKEKSFLNADRAKELEDHFAAGTEKARQKALNREHDDGKTPQQKWDEHFDTFEPTLSDVFPQVLVQDFKRPEHVEIRNSAGEVVRTKQSSWNREELTDLLQAVYVEWKARWRDVAAPGEFAPSALLRTWRVLSKSLPCFACLCFEADVLENEPLAAGRHKTNRPHSLSLQEIFASAGAGAAEAANGSDGTSIMGTSKTSVIQPTPPPVITKNFPTKHEAIAAHRAVQAVIRADGSLALIQDEVEDGGQVAVVSCQILAVPRRRTGSSGEDMLLLGDVIFKRARATGPTAKPEQHSSVYTHHHLRNPVPAPAGEDVVKQEVVDSEPRGTVALRLRRPCAEFVAAVERIRRAKEMQNQAEAALEAAAAGVEHKSRSAAGKKSSIRASDGTSSTPTKKPGGTQTHDDESTEKHVHFSLPPGVVQKRLSRGSAGAVRVKDTVHEATGVRKFKVHNQQSASGGANGVGGRGRDAEAEDRMSKHSQQSKRPSLHSAVTAKAAEKFARRQYKHRHHHLHEHTTSSRTKIDATMPISFTKKPGTTMITTLLGPVVTTMGGSPPALPLLSGRPRATADRA
eukprot:g10097.t1